MVMAFLCDFCRLATHFRLFENAKVAPLGCKSGTFRLQNRHRCTLKVAPLRSKSASVRLQKWHFWRINNSVWRFPGGRK